MHWKPTIVLLLLTAAAGAWLWKGDTWAVKFGLRPAAAPAVSDSPTVAALAEKILPDKITKIEMPSPDPSAPFTLERTGDGWKLPGNWPLRKTEVDELVGLLTNLRTRFEPIPFKDPEDFGLAPKQNPVVIRVTAGGENHTLMFGENVDDNAENAFTRPTYLRMDDNPDVLRLGPDVLPVLRRPLDAYRRRQLFPDVDRVKLPGSRSLEPFASPQAAAITPIIGDKVASIEVAGPGSEISVFGLKVPVPDGRFKLTRTSPTPAPVARDKSAVDPAVTPAQLASAWERSAPVRDRVDPDRLRSVLTALPDLWADVFVPNTDAFFSFANFLAAPTSSGSLPLGAALIDASRSPAWLQARFKGMGLEHPERTITLTRQDGSKVSLLIGKVAMVKTREETVPPPPQRPGMPPMPPSTRTIREEYRYAKLADNAVTFLVRADRFGDVFVKSTEMRDPKLARFEPSEVQDLTVTVKGQPPTKLTRAKGNKDAADEADKQDRWYLARDPNPVLADTAKVDELLNSLSGLEARSARSDIADEPRAEFGIDAKDGTKVTVRTRDKRPDDQPPGPEHTFTFLIGKPDAAAKKLPVQVEGWGRINLVDNTDDRLTKQIDRPAVAYRGRRLFDTAAAELRGVTVNGAGGEVFALQKDAPNDPWKLTQPSTSDADAAKAGQITGDLARLEAIDYVAEKPTPEELAKYGLEKPKLTIKLAFTSRGGGVKDHTLTIGGDPESKPEAYARLDGGSVFTVSKTLVDSLKNGALGLLPLQLLSVPEEKFTGLDVQRGKEEYKLAQVGTNWKLTGPFDAPVSHLAIQPEFSLLGGLKAERYESLSFTDPATFGLDKPELRVTATFKEPKPGGGDQVASRTLVVGKPTPDGAGRFARLEGGPITAVFVIPVAIVNVFDKPALDLLDRTPPSLIPTSIVKLQVAGPKPEDNVTLVKDDKGAWKAEGGAFTVDGPTVERLLRTVSQVPVLRLAGYGPGVKWAEYGLEKPEWTITATVSADKPETRIVKLGKTEPNGNRFVRVDDGPALGVLAARGAADLARGKLEFVDRTLLTFNPTTLGGFIRKKGSAELDIEPGNVQGWNITKPDKQKADTPLMEELADQLGNLRALRVAAFGPKDVLKSFGLDSPAAVVTLKVGDKSDEKVLKIGKSVDAAKPDGDRFAVVEGSGPDVTVGVLPAPLLKRLLADPIAFRDRTLTKFVDADKLTLERGDRKVTFAKVNGTWRVTEPLKTDAEPAELDEFVNALAKLRADDLVAEKPADLKQYGLDKPDVRWKAFDKGNEVLSLLIGKTEPDGRAFAKLDGKDEIAALDPNLTARVLGEYRKRKVWDDVDASQIESLVISSADRTFQLRKDGPNWFDPTNPTERISTPAVNELLDTLAGLKAQRFIADEKADPKLYGLEKPERVIVLTQRGPGGVVTKTLQIGREEGGSGGKRVYARVLEPGRSDVFIIGEADAAKLLREKGAFVEKK